MIKKFLFALVLTLPAFAQQTWSVVHSDTSLTANALTLQSLSEAQLSAAGTSNVFYTRISNAVVCISQAGSITLERGGTTPTGTLMTTYPTYTKDDQAFQFSSYLKWPFRAYTSSDSTGGKVIARADLTAGGCVSLVGMLSSIRLWSVEMRPKSTSVYTFRVSMTSSGDVVYSINGEASK